MEEILKANYSGKLTIGDRELNCAVLEDGTRILYSNSIFKAFGRPSRGKGKANPRVTNMPSFIDAQNLKPFVDAALGDVTSFSIQYKSSGRILSGYKAEILPLLCDVYLNARSENALTPQQQPLAFAAEILVRSLSKVGITALIDEATGYQEYRDKDELQKVLAKYINAELLTWTRRFPDDFYKEMFRLKNWEYKGNPKPGVVGKITNEIVYNRLPEGVLEELKNKNPLIDGTYRRKYKHHQYLTEQTGIPHLDKHLVSLITLMRISGTWDEFMKYYRKNFNLPEQMEFDLDEA